MREADSPVPNSTRPFETWSSVAMCSASLAGRVKLVGAQAMPWPMRIRLVSAAAAASQVPGAEDSE